jgi:rod shape determining protein RodA
MQKRSLHQLIQWKALWQPWEHSDPMLLGLTIALTFVGGLLIRSTQIQGGWSDFWWQHLLMGAIGVVFSLVLCRFNYQRILRFHWLIYAVINLLLIAVMLVGTKALGAQRWISIFGFHLQPSEFAKLGVIITMAALLQRKQRRRQPTALWQVLGIVAVPWILVLRQPDLGTSLVFGAITLGMLYWANVRLGWLILALSPLFSMIWLNLPLPDRSNLILAGVWALLMATLGWFNFRARWLAALISGMGNFLAGFMGQWAWGLLHDYQKERVVLFLEPEKAPLDGGYHLIQSRIAIGSGGIWGQGLNNGYQTQLQFIPEQHTDFIFSALGEQWGFIGAIAILVLFWLTCWRLVAIARTASDDFGSLLCIGILSMVIFQVIVNISMTIGLAPVTGIPLPWISYGRSALITNFVSLGLAASVANHRQLKRF